MEPTKKATEPGFAQVTQANYQIRTEVSDEIRAKRWGQSGLEPGMVKARNLGDIVTVSHKFPEDGVRHTQILDDNNISVIRFTLSLPEGQTFMAIPAVAVYFDGPAEPDYAWPRTLYQTNYHNVEIIEIDKAHSTANSITTMVRVSNYSSYNVSVIVDVSWFILANSGQTWPVNTQAKTDSSWYNLNT